MGAGPSGIYAADALTRQGEASVDVIDRLPCPFGLVRYGVAPDHEKIRSIAATLRQVLVRDQVRFLGNLAVGKDLSLADLHEFYDAIIFANGAALDRRLGIPGEDLPGSVSATEFVAWYCGHPDADPDGFRLDATSVAVVGVGNVAVDVVRVLAKTVTELSRTDVPEHVLAALGESRVQDIYMIGRRGPAQAKFTTKELRELGELANADVLVDPQELALDAASEQAVAADAVVRRNLAVLQGWAAREPAGRPRRIHVRFLLRPVAIIGSQAVERLRLERTRLDGTGNVTGTGEHEEIPVGMVLRSVGYRGLALPGVPFDERSGTIPNQAGRVLDDGRPVPGEYVAGWIKRGPTGVIGTNKSDASETVASLLADAPALPRASRPNPDDLLAELAARGVDVVPWSGWEAIEAAEASLGAARGAPSVKLARLEALLEAARTAARASTAG